MLIWMNPVPDQSPAWVRERFWARVLAVAQAVALYMSNNHPKMKALLLQVFLSHMGTV